VKRDRVLSDEELRYLLNALLDEQSIFAPLIRFLLLTGQRRAEVAGMTWSELRNLSGEDAIWEIPGERTKNKHSHLVPLQSEARHLLLTAPRISEFVFTTTGDTAVSGFGKVKARLDARIKGMRLSHGLPPLAAWTFHDLRRTMVTVMNEKLGIAPHVVEAVVNHMSGFGEIRRSGSLQSRPLPRGPQAGSSGVARLDYWPLSKILMSRVMVNQSLFFEFFREHLQRSSAAPPAESGARRFHVLLGNCEQNIINRFRFLFRTEFEAKAIL
jgi:hypothetical protein